MYMYTCPLSLAIPPCVARCTGSLPPPCRNARRTTAATAAALASTSPAAGAAPGASAAWDTG